MRRPEFVVHQILDEPDGVEPETDGVRADREVRWRGYDAQRVEIVVDLMDDTIVSAWVTRVNE